jgi:endo-1,4-beta-xylanase
MGSTAPTNLYPDEKGEEIEEWIAEYCGRYPDTDMIVVVNEPLQMHHPSSIAKEAFGDDWILESFALARQYCPSSILILNDYNVLRYETDDFIDLATPLVGSGLIDALGCEGHSLEELTAAELKTSLDAVAALGLPIYITEYDINKSDDVTQLEIMQEQFPVLYEHDAVAGVTYWGYVVGATWLDGSGLILQDGTFRPAMTWLMEYLGRM